jgi:hypothetical protein
MIPLHTITPVEKYGDVPLMTVELARGQYNDHYGVLKDMWLEGDVALALWQANDGNQFVITLDGDYQEDRRWWPERIPEIRDGEYHWYMYATYGLNTRPGGPPSLLHYEPGGADYDALDSGEEFWEDHEDEEFDGGEP